MFYLPESKIIRDVSIKDQSYKKNLYGSDQKLEEYFRMVETKVSIIINRIIETECTSLALEEEIILKHFINLQINRTPEKISGAQSQFDKMIKAAFRHDPRIKFNLDEFTIEMNSPYKFQFVMAFKLTPVLFDLKVSLLKNGSEEDILIGQHPAIVTNPLLYMRKWPGSRQGIGSKGALILLPISPKHVLALYDRQRYALANFERIGTLSSSDVDKINTLQFCYTTDCIYFHRMPDEIKFDVYKKITEKFRASDKNIVSTFEGKRENGRRSEIIMATSEEPPVTPIFGFINPKVLAMREELGPTMDISREAVRDLMDAFEDPTPRRPGI